MSLEIRPIAPLEYPLLTEFMYFATWAPSDVEAPPKDVVYEPKVIVYIEGFGREQDLGVVAEQDGQVIGAAWTRVIRAYGYVDNETPELVVSLLPEYRAQGIGTRLLTYLFELMQKYGYLRVSLSVYKDNPAVRLYKCLGFIVLQDNDEDYVMIKNFAPERMDEFFNVRVGIYDDHMLVDMKLDEFYEVVADLIQPPELSGTDFRLLDLGCGTGLELERLYLKYSFMQVTGIDLSPEMLKCLRTKFSDKSLELICGSFLELDFGTGFDVVLSTYSLHHLCPKAKQRLYEKVRAALQPGGTFVFGDYIASSTEQQDRLMAYAACMRRDNGIADDEYYHLDTPLTAETEVRLMKETGFTSVQLVHQFERASVIVAKT